MANSALEYLLNRDNVKPPVVAPIVTQDKEDEETTAGSSALEYLLDRDEGYVQEQPVVPTEAEEIDPEEDSRFIEYYSSRMIPVPDTAVAYYDYEKEDRTRLEDARAEQQASQDYLDSLSEDELDQFGDAIRKDLRAGEDMRSADPITVAISYLPTKGLMGLGNAVMKLDAWSRDSVEVALENIQEQSPLVFKGIDAVVAGGRYSATNDPTKLADRIMNNFGAFGEFVETIPAIGSLKQAFSTVQLRTSRQSRLALKDQKILKTAQRYNPGGAQLATMQASEEARLAAKAVADKNVELSNQMILEFEEKTGRTISKEVNGNLVYDPDAARTAGKDTAVDITERDGALFDLALGDTTITSPILKPEKFDGIIAVASELKEEIPDAFDNNKPVIDNLLNLTVSKDMIGGQELIDKLNKYGLSFEDYVLTVVGSGSEAGRVLNALSQIKRKKPTTVGDAEKTAREAREAGDFRKTVMRIENVRRGGLVSQIATASRNLSSGALRAPLESLGNVMDTAIYTASEKGSLKGAAQLFSGDNWKGSFSNFKYMFGRPDVAKGYTELILNKPELANQFDKMFNNINEIQKLTGRGTGTAFDTVVSGLEDAVDVLNTPNRWQEYLIRRGTFFAELERLTKREYGVDLIDTLNDGKLNDLLNDASSVRPDKSRSFVSLVDDSVNRALDVTYAKQPEIPVFQSASNFITRNGLTVVMPFPRFMFNSMELLGQYAGGASIPLARKVASIVKKDYRGPLTAKDRQRITRNLMGMATVGAAYTYRTSENVSSDFEQIATGDDAQVDTTAVFPMAQFLYLGEQVKRMQNGTFDDKFDAQEFVEIFTGSNFRTGVGNSILEEVAQIADNTDLTKGEAVGRTVGRALGNYLGTWAVPLAQIIDMERAVGTRGVEYKDVAQDPTLDGVSTAMNEIKRSFQQRGIGITAAEESALPEREYPLYPEGKQRLMPHLKPLGITVTNRPPEDSEYLMRLGLDWSIGSKSKVPSIARFENKMVNGYLDTLADISRNRETSIREEYSNASDKVKDTFTEDEYVLNKLKPFAKAQLSKFKTQIREGAIAQGDDYARALTKYRRVRPDFRKLATVQFVKMYDRDPDALNSQDLNRLIIIAKEYQSAYSQ